MAMESSDFHPEAQLQAQVEATCRLFEACAEAQNSGAWELLMMVNI